MKRTCRLAAWRSACCSAAVLWTAASGAFAALVDFHLTPPSGDVNRFDLTVTISGLGSDSDTAELTGGVAAELDAAFAPGSHEATLSGITFMEQTPGTIALSDIHLEYKAGFITLGRLDSSGMKATLRTPTPPGPVVGETFNTADHRVVVNDGTLEAMILGQTYTIDFSQEPVEGTTEATGYLSVAPPTIANEIATYDATLTLPVDFNQVVLEDPVVVTAAAHGTIEATGQFSRAIRLTWDALGDGNWGELDGSGYSRWLDSGSHRLRQIPEIDTAAVLEANNQLTVAEDRQAASLAVTAGQVSIAPGRTLELAEDAEFSPGTSLALGAGARIELGSGGTMSSLLADHGAQVAGHATLTGKLEPGAGPATLLVEGSLELDDQHGTAEYVCHLADAGLSDLVDVAGPAALDGLLTLKPTGSLATLGDTTRTVFRADPAEGGLTGEFVNYPRTAGPLTDPRPHLGDGVFVGDPAGWGVVYEELGGQVAAVEVRAFQAGAGDTDGNRLVNSRDILAIKRGQAFNNPANWPADWTKGDFDGNQQVNSRDILAIKRAGLFNQGQYPSLAPAAVTQVPEPGALGMLAGGLFGLVLIRRRRGW